MAITRLGLCGSAAAYLGFSPKSSPPPAASYAATWRPVRLTVWTVFRRRFWR